MIIYRIIFLVLIVILVLLVPYLLGLLLKKTFPVYFIWEDDKEDYWFTGLLYIMYGSLFVMLFLFVWEFVVGAR
jgi:hypothetical protein